VKFYSASRLFYAGCLLAALFALGMVLTGIHGPACCETPAAIDSETALLVIDVQEFYFPGGAMPLENPEAAAINCKKLLEKFRRENRRIIHIGHKATQGAAFQADVIPLRAEKIFMKSEVNAFNGTKLLEYLQQNGVKRLVICGMQTHMCVEAAVRAAHDLGFECILIRDACATRDLTFKDTTIKAADVHLSTLSTLDGTYATVIDTETFLNSY
jgi:nicotinamidase-related amidase